MSQVMTNYTTYDLAYYYADLGQLPRLSEEEKQQLIASTTQTTHLNDQARNRLIEGHLKRGNPHRRARKRTKHPVTIAQPLEVVRLTLHHTDPITGKEDTLYTLFYEYYRGYTIYSNEHGRCSIHGKDGCLRIQGMYAAFPTVEQAKNMIKHFQADGRIAQESMNRFVSEDAYHCLNRKWDQYHTQSLQPSLVGA
jgi:hypothetical protein